MYYDLDTLEEFAQELGFTSSRASSETLEVSMFDDAILVFMNLPDENDTLMGFKGTPWHSHARLLLMVDERTYVELDELDVLHGIRNGDVLIVERHLNDALIDRWLTHKLEKIDFQYIEPGEEMRHRRLA